MNREVLKYQSRNRRTEGGLLNCIEDSGVILIGFLAPHNSWAVRVDDFSI